MKVFRCLKCEEIIVTKCEDKKIKCCDEEMVELVPNSTDGASETHKPVIRRVGNLVIVTVGMVKHPMLDVHHIKFVVLETDKGIYYRDMELNGDPVADFLVLNNETVIRAYAYCNNHELWSTDFITNEEKEK